MIVPLLLLGFHFPPQQAVGTSLAVVFLNAVSGSDWSYLIVFAIAMLDAFFPVVPSEATVIAAGVLMLFRPGQGRYHVDMAKLLPVVYDRFHDWHRRMGMERSPLEHISCC